MGLLILLFMIVIPIVEISVFIQANQQIGLWSIIGLVIITAMIGSALLRHQGLSTLSSFYINMNSGKLPIDELFDGLCLLLAGAFLITPGFVTDGFGLILFLPIFRKLIRGILKSQFRKQKIISPYANTDFKQTNKNDSSIIIDGEFHEVETYKENDNKDTDEKNTLSPPRS